MAVRALPALFAAAISTAFAGRCAVETPQTKPVTPGFADIRRDCVCEANRCKWVWVDVPYSAEVTAPPRPMSSLGKPEPMARVTPPPKSDAPALPAPSAAEMALFKERMAAAREKHPDFDQVTSQADVPVSEAMYMAIVKSELAGEIVYWLGRNSAECRRIAGLGQASLIREIARIERILSDQPDESAARATCLPEGTGDPLDNAAVVRLATSGLEEDTFAWLISVRPGQYAISDDAQATLKSSGVPASVIGAMIEKTRCYPR